MTIKLQLDQGVGGQRSMALMANRSVYVAANQLMVVTRRQNVQRRKDPNRTNSVEEREASRTRINRRQQEMAKEELPPINSPQHPEGRADSLPPTPPTEGNNQMEHRRGRIKVLLATKADAQLTEQDHHQDAIQV